VTRVDVHTRFPGISAFLAGYSLDLARDPIPVRPAAHYLMGGIKTDLAGRTNLTGLYAAGEAACTGVHGANRLASNSLLEGLVFGARAAQSMLADDLQMEAVDEARYEPEELNASEDAQVEAVVAELQQSMWVNAGLLRNAAALRQGLSIQERCEAALIQVAENGRASRKLTEAQAMSRVAHAILHSALARTESRGAHFRSDFPKRDDEHFSKHSVLGRNSQVSFETW
jgi:L-aspartate oxidase